jgi:hypothetical protein
LEYGQAKARLPSIIRRQVYHPNTRAAGFRDLMASDAMCRHFAALASLYMGRRLAIGEFEMEYSPERFEHFVTCIELINAAVEEDRRSNQGV